MDRFDAIAAKFNPGRFQILDRVDEYTLYRYYTDTDIVPGIPIHSPIRTDDKVRSFAIYYAIKGSGWDEFEFTWKDHGIGKAGNIFTLIKLMYGYNSFEQAYARVNEDFALDLSLPSSPETKIKLYDKPPRIDCRYRIRSKPLTVAGELFWKQFHIEKDLLDFYETTQVEYYWSHDTQEVPNKAPDPMFAYCIGGYYQLYSPYESKEKKFRNNLPENYFFGYLQLPPTMDLLIIDKSAKDVIFNRKLGYWAVSGKSETTLIPGNKMKEFKDRAKRIVLMLDNDSAGIMQTEKYLQLYPWIEVKFLTAAKDKTDLCLAVGFEESKNIINMLLDESNR